MIGRAGGLSENAAGGAQRLAAAASAGEIVARPETVRWLRDRFRLVRPRREHPKDISARIPLSRPRPLPQGLTPVPGIPSALPGGRRDNVVRAAALPPQLILGEESEGGEAPSEWAMAADPRR